MHLPSIPLFAAAPSTRAADRECQGCDRPSHEVGVLTGYEVEYRGGATAIVRYCDECGGFALENPGWMDVCRGIISVERIGRASSMPQPVRDAAIIGEIRAFEGRVLTEHFGGFAS